MKGLCQCAKLHDLCTDCDWGEIKSTRKKIIFKGTTLIWGIEGKNSESYRGSWIFKKEEKVPLLENFPTEGGRGVSGEVGMVSLLLPVFSYESFPKEIFLTNIHQSVDILYSRWVLDPSNLK